MLIESMIVYMVGGLIGAVIGAILGGLVRRETGEFSFLSYIVVLAIAGGSGYAGAPYLQPHLVPHIRTYLGTPPEVDFANSLAANRVLQAIRVSDPAEYQRIVESAERNLAAYGLGEAERILDGETVLIFLRADELYFPRAPRQALLDYRAGLLDILQELAPEECVTLLRGAQLNDPGNTLTRIAHNNFAQAGGRELYVELLSKLEREALPYSPRRGQELFGTVFNNHAETMTTMDLMMFTGERPIFGESVPRFCQLNDRMERDVLEHEDAYHAIRWMLEPNRSQSAG